MMMTHQTDIRAFGKDRSLSCDSPVVKLPRGMASPRIVGLNFDAGTLALRTTMDADGHRADFIGGSFECSPTDAHPRLVEWFTTTGMLTDSLMDVVRRAYKDDIIFNMVHLAYESAADERIHVGKQGFDIHMGETTQAAHDMDLTFNFECDEPNMWGKINGTPFDVWHWGNDSEAALSDEEESAVTGAWGRGIRVLDFITDRIIEQVGEDIIRAAQ